MCCTQRIAHRKTADVTRGGIVAGICLHFFSGHLDLSNAWKVTDTDILFVLQSEQNSIMADQNRPFCRGGRYDP
jgi:hypothetical protein